VSRIVGKDADTVGRCSSTGGGSVAGASTSRTGSTTSTPPGAAALATAGPVTRTALSSPIPLNAARPAASLSTI
jgi:hypothetical protein